MLFVSQPREIFSDFVDFKTTPRSDPKFDYFYFLLGFNIDKQLYLVAYLISSAVRSPFIKDNK